MRTFVYVDGFNLYYGALKRTPYKWLDLASLMTALLPSNQVLKIKLFTARITPRPDDPQAHERQNIYLRALAAHGGNVEIIFGHFLTQSVRMYLAHPPLTGAKTVEVEKTEEKGSDVNLAVHMLNDAWLDRYDSAVVVSNDSDLAEAMKLVKATGKSTGLVTPSRRRASQQLVKHADFRKQIRPNHLAAAQLPIKIPGTKLSKPASW